MIIFGTRTVETTKARGEFICPGCSGEQKYVKKRARSFFHIYFIPLIPVSGGHEFVKCKKCRQAYMEAVLDPSVQASGRNSRQVFEEALMAVVVEMIAADGRVENQELVAAREIIASVAGKELTLDQLEDVVASSIESGLDLESRLEAVLPLLDEHGKEMIVRIAFAISASDGDYAVDEAKVLTRIAESLKMAPMHFGALMLELAPKPTKN